MINTNSTTKIDVTDGIVRLDDSTDAPDIWDPSLPPGGFVCAACRTPVESEPCEEHQPIAYGRIS